jgi:hypothetical protein
MTFFRTLNLDFFTHKKECMTFFRTLRGRNGGISFIEFNIDCPVHLSII